MVIKRGSDREHGPNSVLSAPHLLLCLLVAEFTKRLLYIYLLPPQRNGDWGVKHTKVVQFWKHLIHILIIYTML